MAFQAVDLVERAAARFDIAAPPSAWPEFDHRAPAPAAEPIVDRTRDESVAHLPACSLDLRGMIDWEGPRTPVMEEIRLIKRRLLRSAFDAENPDEFGRLIMISSPRPGEGKTFTSCNLALSIALEEDHDVLLVDADIARQTARRNFGIVSGVGLVDLLLDPSLKLEDAMLRTNIPRLTILPAGTSNQRSPELLASSRMRALVQAMTARSPNRIVIFDSAPCLVSSDTPALASHVGQALLVVEARKTQESELAAAVQLIGACPRVSLVLNKTRQGRSSSYGAYGAY